jgi:hypothetical protein
LRVDAYIYVVPQQACIDMMPGHNASAQRSPPPFSIIIDKRYFEPYEKVKGDFIY